MTMTTTQAIDEAIALTDRRRVYHPAEVERIIAAGAAVLERGGARTRAEDRIAENLARGRGLRLDGSLG